MEKSAKNIEIVLEQGAGLIQFYRDNPCVAAYELLGVDLAPVQRVVFEAMWFKPYTLAICSRGMGKSSSIEELSNFEDRGLVYLHEVLPPIPNYLNEGEDIVIDYNDSIYTSEGFKNTKKLCLEKGIKGKKLTTKNGLIKRGSNHHPLLTLDEEGKFVYKNLDNFNVGDKLCIQKGQNVFGTNTLNDDTSYLIGLLIGDGSYNQNNPVTISSADEEIVAFCVKYCMKRDLPFSVRMDKRSECLYIFRFSNKFNYFFSKYGLNKVLSYYKEVPYIVRTATKSSQLSFLQGYFDTDGTSEEKTGGVSCCSVSKKLLIEIQMMLLNIGIVTKLRKKKTKSSFGKAYLLDMYSEDSNKFKELVGFRLERKQHNLDKYFENKVLNTNKDTIPHVLHLCKAIISYYNTLYKYNNKILFNIDIFNKKELTYNELHKFLLCYERVVKAGYRLDGVKVAIEYLRSILNYNYYFDTVVSIEEWQGDCYDFEMDMGCDVEPNYMTNGFINHNTFLSGVLASLLCLLYPGYRVGLIAPSFRQCLVTSDTYGTFWTSDGLVNNQDFFNTIECNNTEIQSLYSSNTILNKWKNVERPCIRIKTERGFVFAGTEDHRVLTISKDLNLVYKELKDIDINTQLVIKKGFNLYGKDINLPKLNFIHTHRDKKCSLPKKLTTDFAYWLGLIIGDGSIEYDESSRNYRVNFYSSDTELTNAFKDIGNEVFGLIPWKDFDRSGNVCSCFSSKKLLLFLKECGIDFVKAGKKKIPTIIKKAPKEFMIAFITGLLDTDGDVSKFKDKDNYEWIHIGFCSSSRALAEEYRSVLLNLGIMSSLHEDKREGNTVIEGRVVRKNKAYNVVVTGYDDIRTFNNEIKFRLDRKQSIIDTYLKYKSIKISNTNLIPYSKNIYEAILQELNTTFKDNLEKEELYIIRLGLRCCKKNKSGSITFNKLKYILDLCDKKGIYNDDIIKLQYLLAHDISFVKPTSIESFVSETIDIEVDREHCYFGNGFIHHNSKMIFSEVEKLYSNAPILKEATEKRPIRGSDTCYLKFKSTSGRNGAFIEALPIGADGAKIRGSRFYCLLIDEFAQVPQKIIETVLAPMSITKLDPMKQVRELTRRRELIEAGLATEADFEEDAVNKMIGTSSGYYKFNHMYRRMREYWTQIEEGSKDHAVFQIPYTVLPEGFLDPKNIKNAQRVMSNHEFQMEYMGAMVSDSEGFFKASLLETCISNEFGIEMKGDSRSNYLIGIDPNQGGKAKCGLVIVKIGKPNKIVRVLEIDGKTTQDITSNLQELCEQYNVIRIFMDKGGGGKAVADLLEEGYNDKEPIICRNVKEKIKLAGRHILELTTFSTSWIADANFATLALFEDKQLLFPQVPISETKDMIIDEYETIDKLKKQCLNIVVTQTSGGALHFDTPKKGQNKDIYSALILAGYGTKALELELEEEEVSMLHNASGLVRGRGNNNWGVIGPGTSNDKASGAALLKRPQ